MLTVPLDYEDDAAGTTDIAFIKWTNPNGTYNSSSTHDILTNPGGPGGSGVKFLIDTIEYFKLAIGTDYNLVGFDPRGVNNSGPDISCFPGTKNTRVLYDRDLGIPTDANDTNSLAETWARAGAAGEWCSRVHSGGNSSAKYVNTVATATDMLHYTELLAKSQGEDPDTSQLWYYGGSYGTVLGSTYAALFPDRVGRVVLDGVVDGEDYYQGKWEANLPDADAAVETFFQYCFDAGSERCDFWADSPDAIKARYNTVVDSLKARPITVTDPAVAEFPSIFRYVDYQRALLSAPYSPSVYYPLLATGLAALEAGDGSILATVSVSSRRKDNCSAIASELGQNEPLVFIACNDANGRYNLTDYDAWLNHVDTLVGESQYLGGAWASAVAVNCRSLNIRAPESQVFTGPPSADNTSNPVLFVSNTLDPVTPLRAAEKMTKLFGGSGLLVQNAVGHTSESAVSNCTFRYLRQYLLDASLPPEGTVCEADEVPFITTNITSAVRDTQVIRKRHQL